MKRMLVAMEPTARYESEVAGVYIALVTLPLTKYGVHLRTAVGTAAYSRAALGKIATINTGLNTNPLNRRGKIVFASRDGTVKNG